MQDHDGREHSGDGAEHIAQHMHCRATHVEAVACAMKEQEGDDVHREAADGDDEHGRGCHIDGFDDTEGGFEDDPDGERDHGRAIEEGRENFGAVIAEGARAVGGAAGKAYGEPCERQRARVGEHVACVGDERE